MRRLPLLPLQYISKYCPSVIICKSPLRYISKYCPTVTVCKSLLRYKSKYCPTVNVFMLKIILICSIKLGIFIVMKF